MSTSSCYRCGGFLVPDHNDFDGHGFKCLNCGGVMPRFTSEEAKQQWLEKIRATRAAKKNGGKPHAAAPKSTGIAGAIDEIDSKIAALENLKRQLRHAADLVNA